MKKRSAVLVLLGLIGGRALPQTTSAIVGAGYAPTTPITVAPGQIITVFVTGFATPADQIAASTVPLPRKLGGISATLVPTAPAISVPILGISSVNTCLLQVPTPGLSCGTVTGVTVQIPFEIVVDWGNIETPPTVTYLTISDDSGHSASVRLLPLPDQIHVVVKGNVILANGVVTHADGTVIDAAHPARSGEVVVMYAYGLGKTTPTVITGAASPSVAVSEQGFQLNFDYRPNAMPSPGKTVFGSSAGPVPLFAGLTPGFVGLYQINFAIPAAPAGLPSCSELPGLGRPILSNLTVTLVGATSFDGAGICVSGT